MAKEKKEKPFYKKWWFILIVLLVFAFIGNMTEEDTVDDSKKEVQSKEKKEKTDTNKKKEQKGSSDKKDKEKKKEPKTKKENKQKKEKKNEPIDKKIVKNNSNVDKAKFTSDDVLQIEINPSSVWSENSFVTTYTYHALEAIDEAFKDKKVNKVEVQINTKFTDSKGNESTGQAVRINYDRDTFEELNYKKFKTMAGGQEWRILNESNSYFIHPGIFREIKDKYKENLTYGMSKSDVSSFE